MDILVISDEPALGETLASELPECSLLQASRQEAKQRLESDSFRLVLVDSDAQSAVDAGIPAHIAVRPVRLSDLLNAVRSRLESKSGLLRTEIPLAQGYSLSPVERVIRSGDQATRITLTEKEVELLLCLRENMAQPLTREALLKRVWGYSDAVTTHTLETHIYRLRGKLRQAHESFDITFSEDTGYRLVCA